MPRSLNAPRICSGHKRISACKEAVFIPAIERPIPTAIAPERAYLVGVDWKEQKFPVEESLAELARLADTAGAQVIGSTYQRIDKPNPRTFIGSGKADEVAEYVKANNIDVVIFDDELTPSQQTNLERLVPKDVKIIDRTALILDIFGIHAKSREGKLQVQLAQLQYLLPRLRGMWSHLVKEQTRGGIGSRFGQGESQLEVDRRLIRNKISSLKRELKQVSRVRDTQRKARWGSSIFRVALAGYTNAGKSTLLNTLTGANVYAHDQLFATLDPTTRTLVLPEGREISLTDTVGFIQKLPTTLVESFNSTLAEVIGADLILKVTDMSSEFRDEQMDAVQGVLDSIGAGKIPTVTVYNKADLIGEEELEAFKTRHRNALVVSAQTGYGIEELIARIAKIASASDETLSVLIPYPEGTLLQIAHAQAHIISEDFTENGIQMTLRVPVALASRFKPFALESAEL